MRHAKAEPAGSAPDEIRPLALKGRRQATAVAGMLNDLEIRPDTIWCSTALRTKQTLELVNAKLDHQAPVEFRSELYVARVRDVLTMVQALDAVSTLLIVGHEPVMSATAAYLASENSHQGAYYQARIGVPTASFMVLESELPWAQWDSKAIDLQLLARPEVL